MNATGQNLSCLAKFQPSSKLLAALLLGLCCGCSPKAKLARLEGKADAFYQAEKYDSARIEYLNLLQKDRLNATAVRRLGLLWAAEGAPHRAIPFLEKARELLPPDLLVETKLADSLLMTGDAARARKVVLEILQRAPEHDEAIMMLASSCRTASEVAETKMLLAKASPEHAAVQLARGSLAVLEGDRVLAEESVTRALALDPKSFAAFLAAGHLHWSKREFKAAEEAFKTARDLAPLRSSGRLQWAEFKIKTGAAPEAKAMLTSLTKQAPDYLPAWILLAQVSWAEGKYDEATALLANVFGRDPEHFDARLLEARCWLAKGDTKKAIEILKREEHLYTESPVLLYELGRAYQQEQNSARATAALQQAVSINPDFEAAVLLLAQINVRNGDPSAAVQAMSALLEKRPEARDAALVLVEAYRSLGQTEKALSILHGEAKKTPRDIGPHLLAGILLRQSGALEKSREEFAQCLEIEPQNLPALCQLIEMDAAAGNLERAKEQLAALLAGSPKLAQARFLEAQLYVAQKSWEPAEAALRKTIELDPNFFSAYELLVFTFKQRGQLAEATQELQALLAKNPMDTRALLELALTYEQARDLPNAQAAYERVIAIQPSSFLALNNLANIYLTITARLPEAEELARKACRLATPNSRAAAAAADTLGWILFQRKQYAPALASVIQAAKGWNDNPEIQFHLGMAHYALGNVTAARSAFTQATASPTAFSGAAESRRRLALLGDEKDGAISISTEELEALLREAPSDAIVLSHLGNRYAETGASDKAANCYLTVLKQNPASAISLLKLGELYAGPLQDEARALEYATKASKLAPADLNVGKLLGRMLYRTGNLTRAYTVLQETGRQFPQDFDVQLQLAKTAYGLGKVDEARRLLQKALAAAPGNSHAQEITVFLDLTLAGQNIESARAAAGKAKDWLAVDPTSVPAQMIVAMLQTADGDELAAISTYTEILTRFSDFAPAQKQLAALYAQDPENLNQAMSLAAKARATMPDDTEFDEILAEIAYHRGAFQYALQLLQHPTGKSVPTAKSYFIQGMSEWQLKQTSLSQASLQLALKAGLNGARAEQAKRTLVKIEQPSADSSDR